MALDKYVIKNGNDKFEEDESIEYGFPCCACEHRVKDAKEEPCNSCGHSLYAVSLVDIENKIKWMTEWAEKNKCYIDLEGSCGFGRDCTGILYGGTYPDYYWYDDDYNERIDNNGEVWVPRDAYYKHCCVAVLGHGDESINQLYDWLKWFDNNGFRVKVEHLDKSKLSAIELMMNKHILVRMVRG